MISFFKRNKEIDIPFYEIKSDICMLIISIIGSFAQYVLRQTLSRVLNVSELFIPGLPIQSSYSTIYLCLQSAHPAVHLHFFLLHCSQVFTFTHTGTVALEVKIISFYIPHGIKPVNCSLHI